MANDATLGRSIEGAASSVQMGLASWSVSPGSRSALWNLLPLVAPVSVAMREAWRNDALYVLGVRGPPPPGKTEEDRPPKSESYDWWPVGVAGVGAAAATLLLFLEPKR